MNQSEIKRTKLAGILQLSFWKTDEANFWISCFVKNKMAPSFRPPPFNGPTLYIVADDDDGDDIC